MKDVIYDDYNDYYRYILDRVNFADVMRKLKLRPEEVYGESNTYRMTCPFKFHKNGHERTASFRFNAKTNVFFCFGCNEGSNILRFLQLYLGGSDQYNLQRLAIMFGLVDNGKLQIPENYIEPAPEIPKETNYRILFDMGLLLRDYLLPLRETKIYQEECGWVDRMFIKIDKYFSSIGEEDIDSANIAYNKLVVSLDKRKRKLSQ
jgi:hypothetical protein